MDQDSNLVALGRLCNLHQSTESNASLLRRAEAHPLQVYGLREGHPDLLIGPQAPFQYLLEHPRNTLPLSLLG